MTDSSQTLELPLERALPAVSCAPSEATWKTFGSILDANGGVGPGFDFVRLFLASGVVLWHSVFYTRSMDVARIYAAGPFGPPINLLVPLFFALSGFVVTGSFFRLRDLKIFIAYRVLRIAPAMIVEVLISAVALGSLATTLPLSQYFSDAEFLSYFSNLVGGVQFQLPGVFKDQFHDWVNAALWTVPGEMLCYASVVMLVIAGVFMRRFALLGVFLLATSAEYLWDHAVAPIWLPWIPLVFYFYAGSLLFHFSRSVPAHWSIAFGALALLYLVMRLNSGFDIFVCPVLCAYVVCFAGLQRMPRIKYLMDGDYSYGIYLYHSPIVQTTIWLSGSMIAWWQCLLVSYLAVVPIAMLSWRLIEKPSLSLKHAIISRESCQLRPGLPV